ncbi:MAG: phosphoribosylanthranilate isomerase [Lachnospiraceae bacterium]
MHDVKIKICGLSRPDDIAFVNELLPEYIGFVFAKSRRQISPQQAQELKAKLDKRIKSVGVFVNEPIEQIVSIVQVQSIDLVQLHGEEDATYIQTLKSRIPVPIIRAVRVKNREQLTQIDAQKHAYLLLDTYCKGQHGGSGESFDTHLIPPLTTPFFLAGGLHEDNVAEKIRLSRPFAVDVSSGVESQGVKDYDKIKRFITSVRQGETI